MSLVNIEMRKLSLLNTDPQRRCYNGCHAKSELRWGLWEVVEYQIPQEKADDRLKFWRELNDYAVSERGEGARREYRIEPTEASQ